MAERKNTGIAVADAKRLNDCCNELSAAIAARPALRGDRELWAYDYAALPGGPEGAERDAWNHQCGSGDVALVALRGAVTNGNLQLWTFSSHGEVRVDRYELKEPTFATFKSGTYQPDNRLLDSAGLADSPLWVKEADWRAFMANLWALRYGIDWANPAPPADIPLLPPEGQFVTLSHALTWIAFGVSMGNDHLHEVLSQDRYGEHDSQEAIKDAVARLCELGSGGKIVLWGKHREKRDDDERRLLTAAIEPIRLVDFRQFSYLDNELRHGEGLLFWRDEGGQIFRNSFPSGRQDSYLHVTASRQQLMQEFQPTALAHSKTASRAFTRDVTATPAPWWNVNQALGWIATRQVDFVEWIGSRERRDSAIGRVLIHFLVDQDIASVQPVSLVKDAWPNASVLGQAGRLLLGAIVGGEVTARVRGSAIPIESFVGIGLDSTGADWLDLDPQPMFASYEIMRIFPLAEAVTGASIVAGAKGGRPPEVDWPAMQRLAEDAVQAHPEIRRSKLADSLVAEYAAKVSASAPVKRTVERKLATWGMGATKLLSS